MTCEFCTSPPVTRIFNVRDRNRVVREGYERFACERHLRWVKILIAIDNGVCTYEFEIVDGTAPREGQ